MSAAGRTEIDRADAGFTLLEMMVVLAALGLIGGLVYPAMAQFSAAARLHATSDRVAVTLESARAHAIRAARPTRVDGSSLPSSDPVRIAIAPAAGIVFYPDGSATGGNVEVADADGRVRYTVTPATGAIVRAAP